MWAAVEGGGARTRVTGQCWAPGRDRDRLARCANVPDDFGGVSVVGVSIDGWTTVGTCWCRRSVWRGVVARTSG